MAERTSEDWVAELRGEREPRCQQRAFQDLLDFLLLCVRSYLHTQMGLRLSIACSSYVYLEQLTHDLVQDSLLIIWQKGLEDFRKEGCFLGYARKIAINVVRQKLRRIYRLREDLYVALDGTDGGEREEVSVTFSFHTIHQENPEKLAIFNEVCRICQDTLEKACSFREREAFTEKYIMGISSKEIATMMETTVNAVNLLTYSARRKMRKALTDNGYTTCLVYSV